jgi:prefoldin subunit 4
MLMLATGISYKIGDSFFSLSLSEAQEMLSKSTEQIDEEVGILEEKLQELRDEIKGLKAHLYARFGKAINLD